MKSRRQNKALHEQCTTRTMETEERNSNRQERPQTRNVVFDHFDTELSRSQIIIRDFTEESNSTTANAFSDALVDAARKASSVKISGAKSSRTYVGEMAIALKKTHHSSSSNFNNDSRASGSSDDTGTGYSRNVVTATGTSTQTGTTTSSGDDGESSRELGSAVGSSENSTISSLFDLTHGRHRCQHHRSSRNNTATEPGAKLNESQGRLADGSGLQLPSYHGLDQFSTRPATVVASTIPPPNAGANSLSGNGGEAERDDLLQRHREPGYHTIRKTFSRLPKRNGSSFHRPTMETSSTKDHWMRKHIRDKYGYSISGCTSEGTPHANRKKKAIHCSNSNKDDAKPRRALPSSYFKDSNEGNGGGSSSGSGTEGGYLGSAESKENESSSSPSVSSSEDMSKGRRSLKDKAKTRAAAIKSRKEQADESGDSSSSEIADFSSGTTSDNGDDGEPRRYIMDPFHSTSPSLSSSNEDDGASSEDGYEATYIHARNQILQGQEDVMRATEKRRAIKETNVAKVTSWSKPQIPKVNDPSGFVHDLSRSPIMTVGSDIMAHVLTFLPPPVILDVLTMPLSKEWRQTFTFQPELWRVLCLVEPFKAEIDDKDDHDVDDSGSEDSFGSIHGDVEEKRSPMLEKYKLLYTSFVRCMKYLAQIREDALNGKAPSYIDYGIAGSNAQQELVGPNKNLQNFLTKARKCQGGLSSAESSSSEEPQQVVAGLVSILGDDTCRKRKRSKNGLKMEKKPKIGNSMITSRLLGPSASGDPGSLQLPWSCAIYSIVNWMVSFTEVEGIQTLCMKVLPFLLENEQQRQTAQRAGLTDIVLRSMLLFPDSAQLHIAAFHTIVLLARPLGGREGMLFHSSMILTGIFCGQNAANPKSGIAVMVDSMKRFEDNDILQAMSCWALVNIALAPAQKAELVKLGGIKATLNAMLRHPFSAEVQFRALFALINMIIPSVRLNTDNREDSVTVEEIRGVSDVSEKEIIDESVSEIAGLVVRTMKNFCSSEAILNRACLVLHNLSLTQEYHSTLLWTPNCYQMLEWCLGNYRTDQVLQQSATGALHRLQVTLSRNDDLRMKFSEKLRSQQQASLYQAHLEALRLHQRQDELHRVQVETEGSEL